MRRILVCLLTLTLSACNMDWLTGVPGTPCQPKVTREMSHTVVDSTLADSLPVARVGACMD